MDYEVAYCGRGPYCNLTCATCYGTIGPKDYEEGAGHRDCAQCGLNRRYHGDCYHGCDDCFKDAL